jgi:hypothetical protein
LKKTIVILLTLGILVSGIGIATAAPLQITANVLSTLNLALDSNALTFDDVQPGLASAPQTLTSTTSGNGSYQLTLTGAGFTAAGKTAPASVLEFKEHSVGNYTIASTGAKNMLAGAATATVEGDAHTFDLRVNFPGTAENGNYIANVTITAVAQ